MCLIYYQNFNVVFIFVSSSRNFPGSSLTFSRLISTSYISSHNSSFVSPRMFIFPEYNNIRNNTILQSIFVKSFFKLFSKIRNIFYYDKIHKMNNRCTHMLSKKSYIPSKWKLIQFDMLLLYYFYY